MNAALDLNKNINSDKRMSGGFQVSEHSNADHIAWLAQSNSANFLRGLVMESLDTETQAILETQIKKKIQRAVQRFIDGQANLVLRQTALLGHLLRTKAVVGATIAMAQKELGATDDPFVKAKLQAQLSYLNTMRDGPMGDAIQRLETPPLMEADELDDFEEQAAEWTHNVFNINHYVSGLHAGSQQIGRMTRALAEIVGTTAQITVAAPSSAYEYLGSLRSHFPSPSAPTKPSFERNLSRHDLSFDDGEEPKPKKKKPVFKNGKLVLVDEDEPGAEEKLLPSEMGLN